MAERTKRQHRPRARTREPRPPEQTLLENEGDEISLDEEPPAGAVSQPQPAIPSSLDPHHGQLQLQQGEASPSRYPFAQSTSGDPHFPSPANPALVEVAAKEELSCSTTSGDSIISDDRAMKANTFRRENSRTLHFELQPAKMVFAFDTGNLPSRLDSIDNVY